MTGIDNFNHREPGKMKESGERDGQPKDRRNKNSYGSLLFSRAIKKWRKEPGSADASL